MNLEIPREIILKTKLGGFLKENYEKYNDSKDSKRKQETFEIWNKTFIENKNLEKIKQREDLLRNLQVSSFIDENVVIGKDIIDVIMSKIKSANVITDKKVMPLFEEYLDGCENVFFIDSITGDSLKEIISVVGKSELPFLIGIGGGRVMDYLKYVMMNTNKFCLAIPSSLATHVYASPKIHVLPAIAKMGVEKTIDGPVPDLAVIDINFLEKLQKNKPRLIRAGLGDLMACITALVDWKLAEETTNVNYSVVDMTNVIIKNLEKIDVGKPLSEWILDYAFIQVLLCQISGWVGSAPVSGSEHLFALAVEQDLKEPPLHGELVALGTIIMSYVQGEDYKKIYQLVKKLGLSTSLSEIGLSKEQTIDALIKTKELGLKKGRFTVVNKLEMDKDYCETIVKNLLDEGIIQD